MGHHLFIYGQKPPLAMRDTQVELVRHFLIEGARQIGDEFIAKAVAAWQWQGPGVWVGVDERVLIGREAVFVASIEVAQKLGDEVSVDYLNSRVKLADGRWLKNLATSDIIVFIRQLQEYLSEGA